MTRISRARANGFDHEEHPGAAALVEVLGERETTLARCCCRVSLRTSAQSPSS